MSKKSIITATLSALAGMTVLTGCEPDKITVEVPVSLIQKAKQGETSYLKIRANGVSEFAPDDIKEKKENIKHIIEGSLGKGGRVTIQNNGGSGLKFSAQWKVPFFKQGCAPKDADSYPFWLVLTKNCNRIILLANKDRISSMNEKLDNVDLMMEKISHLGMTDIVFDNDTDGEFHYTVYGAFIDGNSKISWTQKVAAGEESTVSFGRKSPDSIWHDTDPLVVLPSN